VKGVPAPIERLTKSADNKRYAVQAVRALRNDKTLGDSDRRAELWRAASQPRAIAHNGQIDVVLGLWAVDMISN